MASACGHANRSTKGKEIHLAGNVEAFLVKNNQVHAPELGLDAEKAKIWKSQVLISYSVSDTVYAFLEPYLDSKLNSKEVEETFPGYEGHKPRIFSQDSFNISFISQTIFRPSPSFVHASTYSQWKRKSKKKNLKLGKT